jgi:hypothetical protein
VNSAIERDLRESLEPFDRDPMVEILQVTWRDVRLGNEPGFRLLKILRLFLNATKAFKL